MKSNIGSRSQLPWNMALLVSISRLGDPTWLGIPELNWGVFMIKQKKNQSWWDFPVSPNPLTWGPACHFGLHMYPEQPGSTAIKCGHSSCCRNKRFGTGGIWFSWISTTSMIFHDLVCHLAFIKYIQIQSLNLDLIHYPNIRVSVLYQHPWNI